MIDVLAPRLQYYINRLRDGDPFTFTRLGDGEWSTILQDRGRTSSKSQTLNHPSLKNAMIKVVRDAPNDPRYILSLRPTSFRGSIGTWLKRNTPAWVKWHDCRILYQSSRDGRLYPFIKALQGLEAPIVMVGPKRLERLNETFPIARHVVIPNQNCWEERKRITDEVLEDQSPQCILVSAGPAAKPIVRWLFHHLGQESFIIDTGSLWDVFVGSPSRSYQRRMAQGTIKKNLEGV